MTLGCSAGTFKQPLFGSDGTTCIGVETVDGTKYYADKVVLAAGAWSPVLIDLEDQCCSKVSTTTTQISSILAESLGLHLLQAWVFAYIQLTPKEAGEYKGVPVVYNGDYGFFFEPNE